MMKNETASWKTLLLLSLLLRAFLQPVARPAGVSCLAAIPAGLFLWLLLSLWDRAAPAQPLGWLCPVLLYAAVLSALRLGHALAELEVSDLPEPVLPVLLMLPALLLLSRDFSRLFQFSLAVKWFAVAAALLLAVSLASAFRLERLQAPLDFDGQTFAQTGLSLSELRPEYLLLAVSLRKKQGTAPTPAAATATAWLAGWYLVFRCALALVLELALGAAAGASSQPLQTAARLGALFMLDRVDFVQVILWYLLTLVQLALYLNAAEAQLQKPLRPGVLGAACLAAVLLLSKVPLAELEQVEQIVLTAAFVLGLLWRKRGRKTKCEKNG